MGVVGALVSPGRAVPLKHLAGLPSGDTHEVALGAAIGQPLIREDVTKDVWVETLDSSLLTPDPDDPAHT